MTIPILDTTRHAEVLGEFLITPKSYNATAGETVVYRCQHENANHVVLNISPEEFSDLFLPSTNGALHQLSVFVGTEHILDLNGTRVWCVAVLNGFPLQESHQAKLLTQGKTRCYYNNIHTYSYI